MKKLSFVSVHTSLNAVATSPVLYSGLCTMNLWRLVPAYWATLAPKGHDTKITWNSNYWPTMDSIIHCAQTQLTSMPIINRKKCSIIIIWQREYMSMRIFHCDPPSLHTAWPNLEFYKKVSSSAPKSNPSNCIFSYGVIDYNMMN